MGGNNAVHMAAALAGCRKALVSTGFAISLLFDTTGHRNHSSVFVGAPLLALHVDSFQLGEMFALYPGCSLKKKTTWQLIQVQTVDFHCPAVGSTNQISERFT